MNSLAELQIGFSDALRSGDSPPIELLDELVDDGLAIARFNVYRNNFIVLNGDALADMYPVVKRLVGDKAFRALASAFVRQYPPDSRTLLLYGSDFAGFLADIPELTRVPYLPDIARLEYTWTAAYHAEDALALTQDQFSEIGDEGLAGASLMVHPSLHLIESDFPIYRIWLANQQQSDELLSLDEGGSKIVICRPAQDVEVREVGNGEFTLIQRLQSGDSIEQALRLALEYDAAFDLNNFFTRHLFDGTFIAVDANNKGLTL